MPSVPAAAVQEWRSVSTSVRSCIFRSACTAVGLEPAALSPRTPVVATRRFNSGIQFFTQTHGSEHLFARNLRSPSANRESSLPRGAKLVYANSTLTPSRRDSRGRVPVGRRLRARILALLSADVKSITDPNLCFCVVVSPFRHESHFFSCSCSARPFFFPLLPNAQAPDTTPPTLSTQSPPSNATGVSTSISVRAVFNEPIQASTLQVELVNSSSVSSSVSNSTTIRRRKRQPWFPMRP